MLVKLWRPGHPLVEPPCEGAVLAEDYQEKMADLDQPTVPPVWHLELRDLDHLEELLREFGMLTIVGGEPPQITLGPPY